MRATPERPCTGGAHEGRRVPGGLSGGHRGGGGRPRRADGASRPTRRRKTVRRHPLDGTQYCSVIRNGYGDLARRYAREVIEVEVPFDSAVSPGSVADALVRRPDITVVGVVHCETPCGTVNDLDAIAAAADYGG